MNENVQEFDITIPAVAMTILAIIAGAFVIRILRKTQRSNFLESFRESNIQEVVDAAKQMGLIWMDDVIRLNGLLDRTKYHADALGEFVESLLSRFPSDGNYKVVAEYLAYAKPGYQAKFIGAMTRHEAVDKKFSEIFTKTVQEKENREFEAERAREIEEGVKLCKR